MHIVLVWPEFPDTFWSYRRALRFISKKASIPPLGLLTVAALLPQEWKRKLVDMNITPLIDDDLRQADYVFISAISIQKQSVHALLERCASLGCKVVAGGPLFTTGHDEFPGVDHLVLDEAEITLPGFIDDVLHGVPRRVYTSAMRADLAATPLPAWELLDMRPYASMNIQYSRGCPFNCEFCDITLLYGREMRTKATGRILEELEALYVRGWRGPVFFVDDNFIGNKHALKTDLLPALIRWMEERQHPFTFNTQASINIADDQELLTLMSRAGFSAVFVGIETPHEESLTECAKTQNKKRNLLECIKTIHGYGMEVQAGFIVGFDNDPPSIFETQIAFIQASGIVTAMVGVLSALRGTRLYHRLKDENRLVHGESGDNTDGSINFIPRMEIAQLRRGYQQIVDTIYAPRNYYQRIKTFLSQYRPPARRYSRISGMHVIALLRSMVVLGILGPERLQYWRIFWWTLLTRPRLFPQAVTLMIYGYHYRKTYESAPGNTKEPVFPTTQRFTGEPAFDAR